MATIDRFLEAKKPWNYGKKIDWNPDLHPRDRLGRFRDVFKSILKLLEGDYMDLKTVIDDAPHIQSAYVWRTKEGWEIRGTSDSGTYGIIITPEQLDKDKHIFEDMLKTLNADPPFPDAKKCGCGCGSPVKGNYLPGHDARHKSNLVKAALLGDEDARNTLTEKGWLKFLEKTPEKKKPSKKVDTPAANEGATPDVVPEEMADEEIPPAPDEFQDQIPPDEEKPPPLEPDDAGWEPSDEEMDIAEQQALKDDEDAQALEDDEEDDGEITEDTISKDYVEILGSDKENYSTQEQDDTNEEVAIAVSDNTDEYAGIEPYPQLDTCNCGCGGTKSATAKYLPGHDSRHKSALVKAAKAGDKRAYVTLKEKGWLKFLDKSKPSGAAPAVKSGKTQKFTDEELEYDPSRVPAGMPISDDYVNYRLLDPGPGTMDEQLDRLTERRDAAKSLLDRAMLNETMYRLRGGHMNVAPKPSNSKKKTNGLAALIALADLGVAFNRQRVLEDITTSAGNISYSTISQYLGVETTERFKEVWRKKSNRDQYAKMAAEILDGESDFADYSGPYGSTAVRIALIDKILANRSESGALQHPSVLDMAAGKQLGAFGRQEMIDIFKDPSLVEDIGTIAGPRFSTWNGLWVDNLIEGIETDSNHYFGYHMASGVREALRKAIKSGVTSENLRDYLIASGGEMSWINKLTDTTPIRVSQDGGDTNILKLYDEAAKSGDSQDLDKLSWAYVLAASNLFGRNPYNPRYVELAKTRSFGEFFTNWWNNYGRKAAQAGPNSEWDKQIYVEARDYNLSKNAGLEDILLSEASSHDITLDDQYVDERFVQTLFADEAPDRGRAVFMRDTPLENDYLMIHGYEQERVGEERLAQIMENPGQFLEGRGRIGIEDQAIVEQRLVELGAKVQKSNWSYTGNKYGGWAASGIGKAETDATSLQIDLGDGKLIEYVPDVDNRPKGDGTKQVSASQVKEYLDENVGNGPFISARISRVTADDDKKNYQYVDVIFDTDGQIVQINGGSNEDAETMKILLGEMTTEQTKKPLYNPSVYISPWDLSNKGGSLIFRYMRPDYYDTSNMQMSERNAVTYKRAEMMKQAGLVESEVLRTLNDRLSQHGLQINKSQRYDANGNKIESPRIAVLERNAKPARVRGVQSGMSFKKINELYIDANASLGSLPSGIDTKGFKFNIRSQRRTIKFTGMSPQEITSWLEEAFDGATESKVPFHQVYGGDRKTGKPNILLDAYADGSVKPDFNDRGVVHRSATDQSGFLDIMRSGSILSISEKIERARHGRKVHHGTSPQGDIGSGLDEFAFASLGSGVDYIGKWSIIYRTEMAMRGDTIFTGHDFGGGSDRYSRYEAYMRRFGGVFGYGLPADKIVASDRVSANDFSPTSNEINFKQELAHEDIAAINLPAHWENHPDVIKGIEELKKVNPDVHVIFTEGSGAYKQLEANRSFISEYNQKHGFKRVDDNIKQLARDEKIAPGDVAYMQTLGLQEYGNLYTELPVIIDSIDEETGEIKGTISGDILKFMPFNQQQLAERGIDVSGRVVTLTPLNILYFRKALSNYND